MRDQNEESHQEAQNYSTVLGEPLTRPIGLIDAIELEFYSP